MSRSEILESDKSRRTSSNDGDTHDCWICEGALEASAERPLAAALAERFVSIRRKLCLEEAVLQGCKPKFVQLIYFSPLNLLSHACTMPLSDERYLSRLEEFLPFTFLRYRGVYSCHDHFNKVSPDPKISIAKNGFE